MVLLLIRSILGGTRFENLFATFRFGLLFIFLLRFRYLFWLRTTICLIPLDVEPIFFHSGNENGQLGILLTLFYDRIYYLNGLVVENIDFRLLLLLLLIDLLRLPLFQLLESFGSLSLQFIKFISKLYLDSIYHWLKFRFYLLKFRLMNRLLLLYSNSISSLDLVHYHR